MACAGSQCRFACGFFTLWLFCGGAVFGDAPWFYRAWQVDDGMPGDSVSGVAQTRDGYLWIGTQSGLARFDGARFQNVPVPVGRTYPLIRAMALDQQDVFWLAQENGVLVRFTPNASTLITNGLSRAQPLEMVEQGDAMWITYADGSVCRVRGNEVQRFAEEDGLTGTGACCLATDTQGQLWFAKAGQVGVFRENRFISEFTFSERFIHIQPSRSGGLWICASDRLLKSKLNSQPIEVGKIESDSVVRPTTLFEDSSGALWIGTFSSGVFRFDGTNALNIETSHSRIRTITEDREENIWVGTDGGGLNRLRQQVIELQGRDSGLPFDTVRSACEDASGALWAVLQNGEVARNDGQGWRTISSDEIWPGGQATCIVAESNGVVWIGTYLRGLYRWENGSFTVLRRRDGLAASSIRSLLLDRAGNLWIAYSTGDVLQRMSGGQFKDFALPPGSRPIRAMTEDALGRIWMANLDAQLLRVDGDIVVDETSRTPEPYRPIRCLVGTSDGALWIGYSAVGVGRLRDGKFTRISTDQGLLDASICSMITDDRGWMWFGSDHGIFRARLDELNSTADGKTPRLKSSGYGRDDGLPSVQAYYGYSPGAARCRDGRLLIPTHSGLAIVHPNQVQTNRVAPPVIIERVVVDNRELPVDEPATLPPNHHKIEIEFTAPSFVEPKKVRSFNEPQQVQFRCKLEGWDDDWVNIESQRSATYSRLPAGRYKFLVSASVNAGVWNEPGAAFAFEVEPFIWQTWWFFGGTVLVFTGVVVAAARYFSLRRVRVKIEQLERENALQKERARIARDIHDDFGATMTQISLLAELTQQSLQYPAKAGEHVEQIAAVSRQGIKSLDEIVWAVNPRNDTVPDLLDYVGQYAVDFLGAAGIRCRVDFPDSPPARTLSAELRHGLFLAVKEALNNVVKHSQASEVWVRANIVSDRLQLSVEDNGRGFERAPDNALADGLRNFQQRLAHLGGVCSIETKPGTGVKVRFQVPCNE